MSRLTTLRDNHHSLAAALANRLGKGDSLANAAKAIGASEASLRRLIVDPTFRQLIDSYSGGEAEIDAEKAESKSAAYSTSRNSCALASARTPTARLAA